MLNKITLKLFPVLITLLFFFPILKENYSTILVILLCLNLIIYKIVNSDKSFIPLSIFVLTIPFWIVFINSLFTSNLKIGFSHAQHSLFFLIIPIVFYLTPIQFFTKSYLETYIKILKFVCLSIAIIYVVSFFYYTPLWQFDIVFNNESKFRHFVYNDFALFKIHPTYYTAFLIFCAAHSFDLVLQQKKYSQLIFVTAFFVITVLLLTKLNLLILLSILLYMVFFRSELKLKYKLLMTSSMILVSALLLIYTPGMIDRFTELINSFNTKPVELAYDSTNLRKAIFDSSVAIFKENPILGVGFENLQDTLNETYAENYNSSFFEERDYMTHNYYFYVLLSSGLLGFIFYLYYLYSLIKIGLKSKTFMLSVLLFSILLICFIEDYFFRQYGSLYFNLILMCYIKNRLSNSENSLNLTF